MFNVLVFFWRVNYNFIKSCWKLICCWAKLFYPRSFWLQSYILPLDSVAVFSFSWKGLWPHNTATVVLFVLYRIGTCQEKYKIGHWSSIIQKEKGHKSPPLSDDRRPKYSRNVSLLVKCQMPNVKYQRGCGVKGTAVSSLLTSFSASFPYGREFLDK